MLKGHDEIVSGINTFSKKNRGGLNKMQNLILQSLSDIIQLIRFQIVLD